MEWALVGLVVLEKVTLLVALILGYRLLRDDGPTTDEYEGTVSGGVVEQGEDTDLDARRRRVPMGFR